jgi:hypothetical protein
LAGNFVFAVGALLKRDSDQEKTFALEKRSYKRKNCLTPKSTNSRYPLRPMIKGLIKV